MNRATQLRTIVWLALSCLILAQIPYLSAGLAYLAFLNLAAVMFITITIFVNPTLAIDRLTDAYRSNQVPRRYSLILSVLRSLVCFFAGFPMAALASAFSIIITTATIDPFVKQHL